MEIIPKSKTYYLIVLTALILTACAGTVPANNGSAGNTANGGNGAAGDDGSSSKFATITEIEGSVESRSTGNDAFAAAQIGDLLYFEGQLKTEVDSRSRIDFEDGTIVRVGPSTTFTMDTIEESAADGGLLKRLKLELGKVWVILNGGALEIETIDGVAAVRGSYLSVSPTGITCLEGTCTFETEAGIITLGAGETATFTSLGEFPDVGVMSDEDFQIWLDNAKEEVLLVIDEIPGAIGNFVWNDANSNGMQDDGEFGMEGVGVFLMDSAGAILNTTTTNADGFYFFFGVTPGNYILRFLVPEGYAFTLKDAGDDQLDSDVNESGDTDLFTTTGIPAGMWDAGLVAVEAEIVPFGPPVGGVGGTCYGPTADDFPNGVNPMTGQPVSNPANLDLPGVLVSVSNFPVSARPQSGLSFSPLIMEIYIGEGMTRFMTIFYGEFPEASTPMIGDCPVRTEPFTYDDTMVGDRVWVDKNKDGIQDVLEIGLPGVCVDLLDEGGSVIASTSTDWNGYYGFDVAAGGVYSVRVKLPLGYGFSPQDVGADDYADSDVNTSSGETALFGVAGDDSSRDAGVFLLDQPLGGDEPVVVEDGMTALGDTVWFDANANGLQDAGEYGVPGVAVELYKYDAVAGFQLHANTVTDYKGFYLFENLPADGDYRLHFYPLTGLAFTGQDIGPNDEVDSDVDGAGTVLFYSHDLLAGANTQVDAGLIYAGGNAGDAGTGDISASGGIGPIRSGRLPYKYINDFLPGSCLVYAGKSPDVDIPSCASSFNKGTGNKDVNANFMGIANLKGLAEGLGQPPHGVNYSGNLFCVDPPSGGVAVPEWIMFYNINTQIKWVYDALSGGWQRNHDVADGSGSFQTSTDRLNGSQLVYQNVIVMFAGHDVLNSTGTIIDIGIGDIGIMGRAILFRDGQAFDIYWTTAGREWEKETGQRRPIKWVDAAGNPIALKPGSTWVHVVTTNTCIADGIFAGDCLPGNNQSAGAMNGLWPAITPYVRFFSP